MTYPYENPQLSVDARVADLLARMSIPQKIGLMYHSQVEMQPIDQSDRYGRPSLHTLVVEHSMTHFCVQGKVESGRQIARWHNEIQRLAAGQPLGIPVTISTDPRHSVTDNPLCSNDAGALSQWPEPLGIAAIGSSETARRFGDVARQEYLAAGIRVALGPQIDLATEPRWARIAQTFGEDAALTGELVTAYLAGLQGSDLGVDSVAAMTKHFPGGGPQKDGLDPHFSDGKEQIYPGDGFGYHLQPFIAAIAAGSSQIMPYYGVPVGLEYEEVGFAFSKQIITDLLRGELGFTGVVCTDFGLVSGYGDFLPAKAWGAEHLDREERTVKLLDAGIDQFGGETSTAVLQALVERGVVPEDRLDDSVRRLLREKFRLGLFDARRYVDEEAADLVIGASEFVEDGLRAQRESVTLLTNGTAADPLLPLTPGLRVYVEGMDPESFAGRAEVVADPELADIVVARMASASYHDPARGFLGSMHKGSLEYTTDVIDRLRALGSTIPLIVDVYLERPGVLTPIVEIAGAVTGSFGTSDAAFADILFGDAAPAGRLPFDLPRSMRAVESSRTDVPFDTEDPLFRFGHGFVYGAPLRAR